MPIIILSDVQLPFGADSGKVLTSDGDGNATWQALTNAGVSATAAISESKLALASDAAAGTASRRTLGTGGLQAAAGNDARFGDQRVPIDNSVTSAKIANGAIMDVDINASAAIAPTKIAGTAVVTADTRLSDQRTPLDNSVTSAKIIDGAIVNADINASAGIAKSKLAALNIVNADIAVGAAIAESKLALASDAAAGTASRRTLGTGATQAAAGNDARFTDTRIPNDLSVTNAKVSATAGIERSKLDFGSGLVNGDISAAAGIAKSKLAALAIVNADVDVGAAIAYSKLALAGSVVAGDLATDAVTTVKIADLNVTTAKLADNGVTNAKLADASVGVDQLQDGAVTSLKIGDGNVSTAKLTNDAVTAAKLGPNQTIRNLSSTASTWALLISQNAAATGGRFLILAQSNNGTDNEFYVLDDGTVRADGSIVGGGADYAEWMAHDTNVEFLAGDVVGLNLITGKVRKLQAGDPMVGVISENPAFSAGNPLPMSNRERPGGYSLVGLIGRIEAQARQVEVINGVVFALVNGKRLGYMLADGRTFLDIDKTP